MIIKEVYNQKGEKIDEIKLDDKVFDEEINITLIHQVVKVYLSNQRKGLASTKRRGEVRGGGRKPWRQKGTGRARVGSVRSPLWRGGGVTFGPKPRDYSKKINRRMKVLALKSVLNSKLVDDELLLLDKLTLDTYKTKNMMEVLANLKLPKKNKIRIVVDKVDDNLKLASRNIENLSLEDATTLHTYNAINCKKLILTLGALKILEERIKKWLS